MNGITVETYVSLHYERKELTEKAALQSGDELDATINRLREIDCRLKEADALLPRLTTNFDALYNNIGQEMEVHAICTNLIIKSWWASWLPFGWMHSLAASYYARKARRIYANKKIVEGLAKLQNG
jgi:hypothetical protein